ncbi:MAG: hypothetical protein IJG51_09380 [Synergistaceae bacterium]|nr:hypothetical protein [Synergistaceae bacterium]MBQ3347111.1 hypothetical protein [Synergistaceae bacterium]MBQ3399089.1 hypothetical protein [Synergistaceae bacterium]MBQ3759034.1 hypothetical protein [Synergistaceae bacterium]MBQ6114301.1 hypothetical protein [Synergistaceae bacterium]
MSAQKDKKAPQKPDNKKKIIIGVVAVIVLLNIMWTVTQNKFTPKLDEVKAGMAALEQRIAKLENGGLPDVANLKEEFAALKAVSDKFADRLSNSLKAEEDQLASLEAQVEAQKARVESLKKMASE